MEDNFHTLHALLDESAVGDRADVVVKGEVLVQQAPERRGGRGHATSRPELVTQEATP